MPKFHSKGADGKCAGCKKKLETVHPALANWFWALVVEHPDVHIAVGSRDEKEQNLSFRQKLSNAKWPDSKHNVMKNGKPYSHAVDLFQIDEKGVGVWSPAAMAKVNAWNLVHGFNFTWGGGFKSKAAKALGDFGHFEI